MHEQLGGARNQLYVTHGRTLDLPAVSVSRDAPNGNTIVVRFFGPGSGPLPDCFGTVPCVSGSPSALPFRDQSFDAVVGGESIDLSGAEMFIAEAARVLGRDGRLILRVPVPRSVNGNGDLDLERYSRLMQSAFSEVSTANADTVPPELWLTGVKKTKPGLPGAEHEPRFMSSESAPGNNSQGTVASIGQNTPTEVAESSLLAVQADIAYLHQIVRDLEKQARPSAPFRLLKSAGMLVSALRSPAKWKNFVLWGRVVLKRRTREAWSQNFDPSWYKECYRDVYRSGVSPMLHYVTHGHLEGRGPSPNFDASFYLRRHPDVRSAGINPLLHFVLFGSDERRTIARPAPTESLPESRESTPGPTSAMRVAQPTPVITRVQRITPERPLVSVIIPCFNYGRYVREAIESVHAQTLTNWELIVVEGGSDDGQTPAMLREIEKEGLQNTTILFRSEPHMVGDNRNFAISRARGRYICCLDADDRIKPTYLESAVFLAETYGFDIIYPSVQCFGGTDSRWMLADAEFPGLVDHNQVSTVAVFRKTAWEDVGGYRDWGRGAEYVAEDWDLWVRMVGSGWRAKSIRQPLMMYRVHTEGLWYPSQHSVARQRKSIASANKHLLQSGPMVRCASPAKGWGELCEESDRPAILLALPFLAIGGAERIFEAISRAMIERGDRIVIITTLPLSDAIRDNTAHFESISPHVYPLPGLLDGQETCWPQFLSYLLMRYQVGNILIAGCDFLYHLLPEINRIYPEIGVVDQLFNDQVHLPTNRHYASHIDVTLVPSLPFAERLCTEFGESPSRVAVIPHGVKVSCRENESATLAFNRSGLPATFQGKTLIGFFGRMSAEKAPTDFVEIVRLLASDEGLAFVMTGDGPERPNVLELIARYHLESKIYAPGFVDNPEDIMSAADIVVVPSRLDGMPLVVMEAQALGKAVVASSVGSIPSMVSSGKTGVLCRPGDIHSFVSEIQSLAAKPALRHALGIAGRASVLANHSAEAMVQGYIKAFELAASRSARRVSRTSAACD